MCLKGSSQRCHIRTFLVPQRTLHPRFFIEPSLSYFFDTKSNENEIKYQIRYLIREKVKKGAKNESLNSSFSLDFCIAMCSDLPSLQSKHLDFSIDLIQYNLICTVKI